ncbi:phosphate ABC transporter substrate-binding protein [Agarivorans sp. MS3-6]|uniref:phosphate ABC transporter substrate-binding protein n=1 Tax=Agarivorans sp. TSD2052 TaxID=2937286 RepID=UPI00200C860A|nr:phosphate ABC transporter substrate-binding protein [Agarivorans sp. TSD2052]UPW19060.1 phosphate ABC transporter substrate-binding protein [Agarivorans sp. TSD2052]
MKNLLLALCLSAFSLSCLAAPVVIANPAGPDALSKAEVKKLFLGKLKKLPNGKAPVVIEYNEGDPLRVAFHDVATGKSEAQLQAYWSKLIFTGKAKPPKTAASASVAVSEVAGNADAIAYVDEADVTDAVKVVFTP